MKKIIYTLLKMATLFLSFSGITIAIILRDQIPLPLILLTIILSVLLIAIVISLLIKEDPTNTQTHEKSLEVIEEVEIADELISNPNTEEINIKTTSKKSKERKFIFLPTGDLVRNHKKVSLEIEEDDTPKTLENKITKPILEEKEIFQNPFSFDLDINEQQYENLISIFEDMENENSIVKNPDFDNFDLLPQGIKYYQYSYNDIPVVSIIKQRDGNFKVMAGVSSQNLYEISLLEFDNFKSLEKLYSNSNHIQSVISGGRYRIIDLDSKEEKEISEPHNIQIRLYHSLNK